MTSFWTSQILHAYQQYDKNKKALKVNQNVKNGYWTWNDTVCFCLFDTLLNIWRLSVHLTKEITTYFWPNQIGKKETLGIGTMDFLWLFILLATFYNAWLFCWALFSDLCFCKAWFIVKPEINSSKMQFWYQFDYSSVNNIQLIFQPVCQNNTICNQKVKYSVALLV